MNDIYRYNFPCQFHGYFDSADQMIALYRHLMSSGSGVIICFDYTEDSTEICISKHMMRLFTYHSLSYFWADDNYWRTQFEGVSGVVVRSNVAQPIVRLLLENFDEIEIQLAQIMSSPDFEHLTRHKKGLALAQAVGLVLDQRYNVLPEQAIAIGAAILVMFIPCLAKSKEQTLVQVRKLFRDL